MMREDVRREGSRCREEEGVIVAGEEDLKIRERRPEKGNCRGRVERSRAEGPRPGEEGGRREGTPVTIDGTECAEQGRKEETRGTSVF